jgi:hypothetical protein
MSVVMIAPPAPVLKLTAHYPDRVVREDYLSEAAAWAGRDQHLGLGAFDVTIRGLAVWGAVGCPGCGDDNDLRLTE